MTSRRPLVRPATALAVALPVLLGLASTAACTPPTPGDRPTTTAASSSPSPAHTTPVALRAELAAPPAMSVLDATDDAVTALAVSRLLFASAPVVVLVGAGDAPGQQTASAVATTVGAPVLVLGGGAPDADVVAELDRLGAVSLVAVGDTARSVAVQLADLPTIALAADAEASDLARIAGATSDPDQGDGPRRVAAPVLTPRPTTSASNPSPSATPQTTRSPGLDALPPVQRPAPLTDAVLLALPGSTAAAAQATAQAAGLTVLTVPGGDPRADPAVVAALAASTLGTVVALGVPFGAPDMLGSRVAAASTGVQLPGGGQLVFSDGTRGKRYVALYGTPGTPALGVLGEQDVPATLVRTVEHAAWYTPLTTDAVVPMVEIIATIASAGPGPDGNYSDERPVDALRPLVEAAGQAGIAVVLDLQPGRTDFLTQAQQYEELLALPHVGLALDPEWRLAPDQVHLRQIGSVGVDEVNATSAWLAQLTRDRHLPQKMFVVHQFASRMVADRARLDVSHDELAVLIHVDGQGTQPAKAGTWNALRTDAPPVHWGWKNFYDEDLPMLDPAQTYQVQPLPDLVTYQ